MKINSTCPCLFMRAIWCSMAFRSYYICRTCPGQGGRRKLESVYLGYRQSSSFGLPPTGQPWWGGSGQRFLKWVLEASVPLGRFVKPEHCWALRKTHPIKTSGRRRRSLEMWVFKKVFLTWNLTASKNIIECSQTSEKFSNEIPIGKKKKDSNSIWDGEEGLF